MDKRLSYALWLVVIFLIGLSTRIYLEKYTYIFGFDSYWFARMSEYLIRDGALPDYDPLTFRGYEPVKTMWELSMNFPAWAHNIIYGGTYEKSQLLTVFKWLSALFGAFGAVTITALTTVLAGPVAGILAGIFAATNPGYVYRTMAGFFEDDATAFLIVVATFFAVLAYLADSRKKFFTYVALSSIFMLISAISWQGFYIIPYSAAVFLALWIAYHLATFLSRFLDYKVVRRHERYFVILASTLASLISYFFVQLLARNEVADAIYLTGKLSATSIYTLALSPLSVVFWGIFAATATIALRRRDFSYSSISIIALFLALLTVGSASNHEFTLDITRPDGVDVRESFKLGSYGTALLGSLLLILVGQLSGAVVAFAFLDGRGIKNFSVDWKLLATVFVPLIFASFSCHINGFCWTPNVFGTTSNILASEEEVRPRQGFIEPLTAGPMALVIGEETTGFMNWPAKFGILSVVALFSIPFLAYRVRDNRFYLFILAWVALTWWASWFKLKFAYYFGIPVAIISAIVLSDLLSWANQRKRLFKIAVTTLVFTITMSSVATGIFHTVSKVPTLITYEEAREMSAFGASPKEGYIELFNWIKGNTPEDANLLNWWSIGHWLTFFTERGVMTDNTNARLEADFDAARFFLFDENSSYEIAKERGMNYVIVESSLLGNASALVLYAYELPAFSDPRFRDYSIFSLICKYSAGGPYKGKYLCWNRAGNLVTVLDEETWEGVPSLGGGYRESAEAEARLLVRNKNFGDMEYIIYKNGGAVGKGGEIIAVTPKLNDSTLFKMLTHAPLTRFTHVWSSKDGSVLVYKVI